MKKIYLYGAVMLSLLAFGSCSNDDFTLDGEGYLSISTTFDSTVKLESRAIDDAEKAHLDETLKLWIYKHGDDAANSGVIRQYDGMSQVPTTALALNSGTYSVEAWAGDSVSASWDKRWYHGITDHVSVTKGNETTVKVVCKIANVAVEVKYDDEVKDVLQIDSLVVSHSRGHLAFKGDTPEHTLGYFMMPNGETTLAWTLVGHHKVDGNVEQTVYTVTQNIKDVSKGAKYVFNITLATGESDPIGGGFVDINVVEEPLYSEEDVVTVALAPSITYYSGEDLDTELCFASGQVGEQTIKVQAAGDLTSVVLECEQLTQIFSADHIDLVEMYDETRVKLDEDIIWAMKKDDVTNNSSMYIKFLEQFTNRFKDDGTYTIKITASAKDSAGNNRTTEKTATIIISDSPISATPIDEATASMDELSTTMFKAKGKISNPNELPDNPAITVYYTEGAETSRAEWQTVKATINSDNTYEATIAGLNPATTYSYYAEILQEGGTYVYTEIQHVTTEAALQLPNAGFEDWDTSGKAYLVYPNGGEMFWDSGNHGSSTMSKNITTPDESKKHSGKYSIKMESQFVGLGIIGKFAAGNVFIGKYLKTDGTDGVLGWGRPFTSRPSKLRGWVHYTPGKVTNDDPAYSNLKKGDMDQGIIYIALLDSTIMHSESEYKEFPIVVKTKSSSRSLFDKNGSNVIAYGEKVFTEATSGDELVEFEIPIDYRNIELKPTYIMLTVSASIGGDYFVGGPSVMYLDDLELVYE